MQIVESTDITSAEWLSCHNTFTIPVRDPTYLENFYLEISKIQKK